MKLKREIGNFPIGFLLDSAALSLLAMALKPLTYTSMRFKKLRTRSRRMCSRIQFSANPFPGLGLLTSPVNADEIFAPDAAATATY